MCHYERDQNERSEFGEYFMSIEENLSVVEKSLAINPYQKQLTKRSLGYT